MNPRWSPLWLALLGCLLAARPALAGPEGRLELYVFGPDGRPAAGLEVRAGQQTTHTGADGVAKLALPPGPQRVLLLEQGAVLADQTFPIAAGEVSEVIVHLQAGGEAELDVEAPGWPLPTAGQAPAEGALGDLIGSIKDERSGGPVPGARVLVRGQSIEGQTGPDGTFRVRLPAGTQTVSVIHAEYATLTRQVQIVAGAETHLELTLTPSALELEAHRVSGYKLEGGLASLMDERRDEQAVTEVLGAEQIAKSGDGDAAAALRRVTGLTVVDGKFVYVRGMGQRYSSTLLNGSTLPSPEPERRVVPLDLFPTGVIESISIRKSYSPELPGDFGGGTVALRTKGIPDGLFVQGSASARFREGTTSTNGLTYSGSNTDWLGYDDGSRSLPLGVEIAAARQPLSLQDPFTGEGYPVDVLGALGAAMPNDWSTHRRNVPPDYGLSLSLGNRHDVGSGKLGYRLAASYGNDWFRKKGILRTFGVGSGGNLTTVTDYRDESLQNTVDFSTLASVGYQPVEGQELTFSALWLRRTENETEVYQGLLGNDDLTTRVTRLDFVEQQMITGQVTGEHTLWGDAKLDWRYTYSYADRYQPDSRRTRYDFDPARNVWLLSNRPEGNQRLYNDLQDDNHDVSAGLTIPFTVWSGLEAKLAGGGGYVYRDRESETRRFKFIHRGPRSQDPDVLAQPPELVFAPENLGGDGFSFEEITRATDSYDAQQTIEAVYLRLDLPIHATLDASLGARLERSRQEVNTFDLFSRNANPEQAKLNNTDILPAANLTWRFYEGMQLRGGYSRTLSRPDFRELSTAPFDQVVGAGVFVGNPDLKRTLIDNIDLRWEWYFGDDESLSLGVFYKELHDPIETIILGGANRTVTLTNADRGRNLGLELEFRKRLDFFGPEFLEKFFFSGNLALIRSDVDLASSGVATNDSRPLEGQSQYVINVAFGYDDPDSGASLTVLYNVSGERIVGIGTYGLDDIYEQPFHQLDVVAGWKFWEGWSVRFKAENLLGEEVKLTQGGEIVERYEKGRAFSISMSAKF